jgi:hypothetical protein
MKLTIIDTPVEPAIVAETSNLLFADVNIRDARGHVIVKFTQSIYTHAEKRLDWLKLEVNLSYPKTEPVAKKSKFAL